MMRSNSREDEEKIKNLNFNEIFSIGIFPKIVHTSYKCQQVKYVLFDA